jgi:hypothetical protein
MVNIYEIDWREGWASRAFDALDEGLANVHHQWDDDFDVLPHAEGLAGLGCVLMQMYVAGTIADLGRVFGSCPSASELRRAESPMLNQYLTQIDALWATANYFKHHDEWADWGPGSRGRDTVMALQQMGILQDTSFPCVETMRLVVGDSWQIRSLLDIARLRGPAFSVHYEGEFAAASIL